MAALAHSSPSLYQRRALRLYTDGACIGKEIFAFNSTCSTINGSLVSPCCLSGNANVSKVVCPAGWGVAAVLDSGNPLAGGTSATVNNGGMRTNESAAGVVHLMDMCGPVQLHPGHELYLGAEKGLHFRLQLPLLLVFTNKCYYYAGSNNTAELSAVGEAMRAIVDLADNIALRFPPETMLRFDEVVICYDSEYAAKSTTGEFNGKKNVDMIARVRRWYAAAKEALQRLFDSRTAAGIGAGPPSSTSQRPRLLLPGQLDPMLQHHHSSSRPGSGMAAFQRPVVRLRFEHVKGHSGNTCNDRADRLANIGCSGWSSASPTMRAGFAPTLGPRAEWDFTLLVTPPSALAPPVAAHPSHMADISMPSQLQLPPHITVSTRDHESTAVVQRQIVAPDPPPQQQSSPQVSRSVTKKSTVIRRHRREGDHMLTEEVVTDVEVVETTTVTVRVASSEYVGSVTTPSLPPATATTIRPHFSGRDAPILLSSDDEDAGRATKRTRT